MGSAVSAVTNLIWGSNSPETAEAPVEGTPKQAEEPAAAPTPAPVAVAPAPAPARPVVDRSIYVQKDKTGETIVRVPGQINGNQFNAASLTNCKVIVHDFCDSMLLDKCKDCEFVLSAVRGSIFARNCENCKIVMVTGQFRCRDCSNCDFYMQVKTGPVIESSDNLRIGCALVAYPELLDQMARAKLDATLNLWHDIHDFTPEEGKKHFALCPGQKLDLEINEIQGPLNVFFTLPPNHEGARFAVKIGEDKAALLASQSAEGLGITAIEKSGTEFLCTAIGASEAEIGDALKAFEPISVTPMF